VLRQKTKGVLTLKHVLVVFMGFFLPLFDRTVVDRLGLALGFPAYKAMAPNLQTFISDFL